MHTEWAFLTWESASALETLSPPPPLPIGRRSKTLTFGRER